jgi:uncharacterized membrane protein YphA (DoxX/SURF4 family)
LTVFRHGKKGDILLKRIVEWLFNHSSVELAVRWIIGIVFIYASIHKIIAPGDFARIIYGYGLFPAYTINISAIVFPFVELYCGLSLIAGIRPRSSAILVMILLLVFCFLIFINLVRGHEFDCGCFSVGAKNHTGSNIQLLIRDLVLAGVSLIPVMFRGVRKYVFLD